MTPYQFGTYYENLVQSASQDYSTRIDAEMSNLINKENNPSQVTSKKTHSQMLEIVKKRLTKALQLLMARSSSAPKKQAFQSLLSRVSNASGSSDLTAVVSEALNLQFPDVDM